jgi:IS30 family transposase
MLVILKQPSKRSTYEDIHTLTRGKRYQIRELLKAGFSQSEMDFYLRVNKSTINREIRRNSGDKGYIDLAKLTKKP